MSFEISLAWRLSRANTRKSLKLAGGIHPSFQALQNKLLEMKIRFDVTELGIGTGRIDTLDEILAPSMRIIRRERETVAQRNVHADVPHIGERTIASAGAAGVAEGVRLKRAATAVPKVVRVGQAQGMQLAFDDELTRQAKRC